MQTKTGIQKEKHHQEYREYLTYTQTQCNRSCYMVF